jgi:hypothetical protein
LKQHFTLITPEKLRQFIAYAGHLLEFNEVHNACPSHPAWASLNSAEEKKFARIRLHSKPAINSTVDF